MLLPKRCGGCGRRGPSPCAACVDRLEPVAEVVIEGGPERCVALVAYDELSARLVAGLKYRGLRDVLGWFVAGLVQRIESAGVEVETVTWVPAARHNRRRRGFDQAEALARPLGRRFQIPARPLLRRSPGTGQTGRTRVERLGGPELACARQVTGRVLVVDDVITTGASMRAAAAALHRAGAARVLGAAVAYKR